MRHELVVAAAVFVSLAGGCYKSGGSSGAVAPTSDPPSNRSTVRDYSATLADAVGFLPLDSEIVVSLDADQLRRSVLWSTVEPGLLRAAGGGLQMFKNRCGFDPVTTVRSATIGAKIVDGGGAEGVIVVTGFERQRLMACLTEAARQQPAGALSIADGIVTVPGQGTDPGVVFSFVDATTAVVLIGTNASAARLEAVLDAGAPLRGSPTFVTMLGLVDQGASAWMVINGNSKAFAQAAAMGFRPKAVFGSVSVVSGLNANLRIRLDGAAQATQLATLAQGQLAMASNFFDKLDVVADSDDVVVTAVMTDAQVSTLATMLGGLLGAP